MLAKIALCLLAFATAKEEACNSGVAECPAVTLLQTQVGVRHERQERSNEDKCTCDAGTGASFAQYNRIVTMFSTSKPTAKFCRCAIVGAGSALKGQKLGKAIDTYDTVIRVNRLPQPFQHEDFGSKTDVFFADPGWVGRDHFRSQDGGSYLVEKVAPEGYEDVSMGPAERCSIAEGGPSCASFSTLIMKGSDGFPELKNFSERFPIDQPGWRPDRSAFPIGYEADEIHHSAYYIIGKGEVHDGFSYLPAPTNGFHAFLTFAPLCGSLDLYGFDGKKTYDNHSISFWHNLDHEHDIMDRAAAGDLQTDNWEEYPDVLRKHMQSLGQRGCLRRMRSV